MALSKDLKDTEALIDYVMKLEKRIGKLEQYNRDRRLQQERVRNKRQKRLGEKEL